jgi:hypothetical protein
MSEPMFPSAGQPDASAPVVADEAPSGRGNRKMLLAVGGVAAALVVAGGAFYLLTNSGGGDEQFAGPSTKASAPAKTPTQTQTQKKTTTTTTVKTVVIAGHDPFAVLYPQSSTSTSKGTTSQAAPAAAPAPAPTVASQTQTTKATLVLTSVDQKKGTATLQVDGKSYNATIGVPFATYYQMYAVFNDTCAGFLVGDVSVPVCTTKSVVVTY